MGQEIAGTHFRQRDFERFGRRLREETALLHRWSEDGALSQHAPMAGLELEAWLVDAAGRPAPRNAELLQALQCSDVVTELGRFNFELNVPPQPVAGLGLRRLGEDLAALWGRCRAAAAALGMRAVAVGILPGVREADLALPQLSEGGRYRAMNEQVLRQRRGRPVRLRIDAAADPGAPALDLLHTDVMLEAAATSFQVHLQLPARRMLRAYNAALLASPAVLAAAGNSPLLFGRALWQETRVPLFEQALGIGAWPDAAHPDVPRVGFGSGYVSVSLAECFTENLERFTPLLPAALDAPAERLPHLRLHNGTIWRWIRPVAAFDDDGTPHIRLEHRPLPAGPTLVDMMANLAFVVGLIADLAARDDPPEAALPFDLLHADFHAAARCGLAAPLHAPGAVPGTPAQPAHALLPRLLRCAADGLAALDVDAAWAGQMLEVVGRRVASGRTGAAWLLQAHARHGGDSAALLREYLARQEAGEPVHAWAP
jgi:gamma-glutamyl:cysteine ligase YbdK (ATP-grasp superfamily)